MKPGKFAEFLGLCEKLSEQVGNSQGEARDAIIEKFVLENAYKLVGVKYTDVYDDQFKEKLLSNKAERIDLIARELGTKKEKVTTATEALNLSMEKFKNKGSRKQYDQALSKRIETMLSLFIGTGQVLSPEHLRTLRTKAGEMGLPESFLSELMSRLNVRHDDKMQGGQKTGKPTKTRGVARIVIEGNSEIETNKRIALTDVLPRKRYEFSFQVKNGAGGHLDVAVLTDKKWLSVSSQSVTQDDELPYTIKVTIDLSADPALPVSGAAVQHGKVILKSNNTDQRIEIPVMVEPAGTHELIAQKTKQSIVTTGILMAIALSFTSYTGFKDLPGAPVYLFIMLVALLVFLNQVFRFSRNREINWRWYALPMIPFLLMNLYCFFIMVAALLSVYLCRRLFIAKPSADSLLYRFGIPLAFLGLSTAVVLNTKTSFPDLITPKLNYASDTGYLPFTLVQRTGKIKARTVINLRSGPGESYNVVLRLKNKSGVFVKGRDAFTQWYLVKVFNGRDSLEGYVHPNYVIINPNP